MKKVLLLLMLAITSISTTGCFDRVVPGEAGIMVYNWGNDKGLDIEPLAVGGVWYNPFSQSVYKFPVTQQNYTWDIYGGDDESFIVNSTEGAQLGFDVAVALRFEEEQVPALFARFRRSPTEIINNHVRPLIERQFTERASVMTATDIVGPKKSDLIRAAQDSVKLELQTDGILIDFITITGEIRVDETVQTSINAVLAAAQAGIEARNNIVRANAEATQRIESARGDSASLVISAQGQAEANRLIAQSLTPTLLEYHQVNQWNGQLPEVTGGAVPFINVR